MIVLCGKIQCRNQPLWWSSILLYGVYQVPTLYCSSDVQMLREPRARRSDRGAVRSRSRQPAVDAREEWGEQRNARRQLCWTEGEGEGERVERLPRLRPDQQTAHRGGAREARRARPRAARPGKGARETTKKTRLHKRSLSGLTLAHSSLLIVYFKRIVVHLFNGSLIISVINLSVQHFELLPFSI